MATIVLFRHAEPIIVKGAPSNGWVLSDAGRTAAAALAVKLGGFGLTELSSSLEPKALQTAQIIAGHVGGQILTDIRLREHDRSSVGFLSRENFEASVNSVFGRPNHMAFGRNRPTPCTLVSPLRSKTQRQEVRTWLQQLRMELR